MPTRTGGTRRVLRLGWHCSGSRTQCNGCSCEAVWAAERRHLPDRAQCRWRTSGAGGWGDSNLLNRGARDKACGIRLTQRPQFAAIGSVLGKH